MALDRDLTPGQISVLVEEEGNVIGQPGGGPLAPVAGIPKLTVKRFRAYGSVPATAAGAATIEFSGPTTGFTWLVERIVAQGGGSASFYINAVTDEGFCEYTPSATLDVADENSPIYVPGGQKFIAVFAGAGALTVCKVGIQVALAREA